MKTSESKFSQCLYFTTAALARKVEKLAADSWKPAGLSPSHGYLLLSVLEEPGMQPSALGRQLQLQPSTITRLMEKLETKKLLVRVAEGKQTNVYPTPRARENAAKMKACLTQFHAACARLIGREEAGKLARELAVAADSLDG